jgi:uncharacterized protein DUF5985
MGVAVYLLCALTSCLCAILLLREYRRARTRLLLWTSVSFICWGVNNALVLIDFVVLPEIDLSLLRSAAAFVAVVTMLYGLVWDAA